jgi:branched-chain amino acid transport system substrate-binding protein
MKFRRSQMTVVAAFALVGLIACSSDSNSSSGASGAVTTVSLAADAGPGGSQVPINAVIPDVGALSNDWALGYVGGTGGKADAAASHIVIGYAGEEGTASSAPDYRLGAEAAVAYINDQLGGIKGHPLELRKCSISSEEQGQSCATQLLNDADVKLVNFGLSTIGNSSFWSTLNGTKPAVLDAPVDPSDFGVKNGVSFSPGVPVGIAAQAVFIQKQLPEVKSVAIVFGDFPAARTAAELLVKPRLDKAGITTHEVPIPAAATGPDVQAALAAAGAQNVDAIILENTPGQCNASYDGLKALAIDKPVITTFLCAGQAMFQHLKDLGEPSAFPTNWYFGGSGYTPFIPDEESGMKTYVAAMRKYADPKADLTIAVAGFVPMMTIAKLLNQIGPDNLTPQTFAAAAAAFGGPQMGEPGEQKCGYSPLFPVLCGKLVGFEKFEGGKWVSVLDGLNGQAFTLPDA